MRTPKTPLPEKIIDTAPEGTTFTSLSVTDRKINQIITHLKEREEAQPEKPSLIDEIERLYLMGKHENLPWETAKPLIEKLIRDNAN